MADENTEVDLEELHDAISAQIAAAFPAFKTVEFYRDDETEKIQVPACLLEMTEAEPAAAQDSGTGQWPARLRFTVQIILAHRTKDTAMEVRKVATALATFLHLRHWEGVKTDEAQVIACEPDEFAPNLDKFKIWKVEFVHLAFLGDSVWLDNTPTTPEEVFYSFVPQVGTAHESGYVQVVAPE